VSHSPADSDRDIVMSALEDVVEKDTILVGDDTGLLVMAVQCISEEISFIGFCLTFSTIIGWIIKISEK